MGIIYSFVGFIIAIGVLVAVHEFGHFWVARKLGVKVLTFSVGFGKPLWRKVAGPDQIEYIIGSIPLGGYVKMLGEHTEGEGVQASDAHRSFDNQPVWKRSLIVVAGPAINFLFAIVLFMVLGLQSTDRLVPTFGDVPQESVLAQAGVKPGDELLSVDGKSVDFLFQYDLYIFNRVLQGKPIELLVKSGDRENTVTIATAEMPIYRINPSTLMRQLGFVRLAPTITTEIDALTAGSPAEKGGLQVGDKFVSIDNVAIDKWRDLVSTVQPAAGKPLDIVVERQRQLISTTIVPETIETEGQTFGRLGVGPKILPFPPEYLVTISRSPMQALSYGANQTWLMSTLTMRMLWKMVTLQVSYKNVNGPLMIADVAGKAIQVGLTTYLYFLALISISLGVMNLLPIPMLDGGRLATYVVEVFAGQKAAERVFIATQPFGVLMLAGLMSLAFYNDILKIFN